MTEYRRMYAVLCRAIDGMIEPLRQIPAARGYGELLQKALLEAEEIYIETEAKNEEAEMPETVIPPLPEKTQ